MKMQHLELRLQQVNVSLNTCLNRIHQYEVELMDEDDPNLQSKYQRRIERLKNTVEKYEDEFEKLKAQRANLPVSEAESLAGSFQQTATTVIEVVRDLKALSEKVVVTTLSLSRGNRIQDIVDDTSLGVKHKS